MCDWAHRAILCRGSDGVLSEFVREYEGRDLLGPSGMTTDAKGNIYFTDSGPLGETTLGERGGSVFSISRDGQLLQPLAARGRDGRMHEAEHHSLAAPEAVGAASRA